eukprot:5750591-Amphidinium_carterae.2
MPTWTMSLCEALLWDPNNSVNGCCQARNSEGCNNQPAKCRRRVEIKGDRVKEDHEDLQS